MDENESDDGQGEQASPLRIYFACVGNSARSQMAHGWAEKLGEEHVLVASGGSKPAGRVRAKAIEVMAEVGIDIAEHRSQPIDEAFVEQADVIVTMGCGEDDCPAFVGKQLVDWPLEDPAGQDVATFRRVRDEIEARVRELLAKRIPALGTIAEDQSGRSDRE